MGGSKGVSLQSENVVECDYRMSEWKAEEDRQSSMRMSARRGESSPPRQFIPTPKACLDVYKDIYKDGKVSREEQLILDSFPMQYQVKSDFSRWTESVDQKKVYAKILEKSSDPDIRAKLKLIPKPGETNSLGSKSYGANTVLGQVNGQDFTAEQARDLISGIMAEALGTDPDRVRIGIKVDFEHRRDAPAMTFVVVREDVDLSELNALNFRNIDTHARVSFKGEDLDRFIQKLIDG